MIKNKAIFLKTSVNFERGVSYPVGNFLKHFMTAEKG